MFSVSFQDFGLGISSSSRCDLKHNLVAAGCAQSAVESPASKLQVVENRPLSNKATVATQDITQIQPQRLHIKIRPGGLAHLWVGVWVFMQMLGVEAAACYLLMMVICALNLCMPPPR